MTKAPIITSHDTNCTVHSRLLLVSGHCGSSSGNLWVFFHNYAFPPQSFPVSGGHFKALLHLTPGLNNIRLDFNETARNAAGGYNTFTGSFNTTYTPLTQNPPLQLAILIGSDSKCTYDDIPDCRHPATLDTAVKKMRMAGYLWQAYTGTQMHEHRLGHRTFRLDEAWAPDTLTSKDRKYRSTATVTILRSKHPIKYLRDANRAQQNKSGNATGDLFSIALDAIKAHPPWINCPERLHIACLILDTTWDAPAKLLRAHAALGGGDDKIRLGIFGSHSLFSWPSCMEELIPALTDARPVMRKYCAVDGEGAHHWTAANVGLGAFLHEVGHALGCPHQPHGIMQRDYPRLNAAFSVVQPNVGVSTGRPCEWHRLDALRFRAHPAFALPSDPGAPSAGLTLTPIYEGLVVTAPSGIVLLEFRVDGQEHPKTFLEFTQPPLPTTYTITRRYLLDNLTPSSKVSLMALAVGAPDTRADDVLRMLPSAPDAPLRSVKFGSMTGGTAQSIRIPREIEKIRIYSGSFVDGIEFFPFAGFGAPVLFGGRGGKESWWVLREGEEVRGLCVRAGGFVDAVQIVTGVRRSPWFGGKGGEMSECIVPQGYRVVGVWGEVKGWVWGIGVEYERV